ncbi:pyridoxine kinase [Desulfonispora thiosulfatigenes DSM 11270]|uniref:pyridoxal kinase n=1 Tax=Desulfonispora thiosulfatigenes DSM 11270 TaxID=656914 RepID=A0A1W1V3R2_DESTI|nr:pyridoxamine kinase [Desulfonispora thiosulfatigenes]SMB87926.1 pyridoxine kinase [Desulfonispora thiosulfatigenes DSM 11270]
MRTSVKRVAAIHDLSGFGRSSLSLVIPILSIMGVQACAVPTAILSTHTGDFEGYSFHDFTDHLEGYINHWHQLGIDFDCIYSGFLGSPRQIDIISKMIDDFSGDNTLIVVDPVMGDGGELYSTMCSQMVAKMKTLIEKADIITPNITEAAYLLGEKYEEDLSEAQIKDWLIRLADMGPSTVIITSIPDTQNDKNICTVAYDKKMKRFWKVSTYRIPAHFPGTGDTFTSVIVGSILQGDNLPMALDRGVQFVAEAMRVSYGYDYPKREGILIEKVLGNLKMPFLVSGYEEL